MALSSSGGAITPEPAATTSAATTNRRTAAASPSSYGRLIQSLALRPAVICVLILMSTMAPTVEAQALKDPPPQSWQDIQYYLGAIWLGVCGPTWAIGITLYCLQRDKQPIRSGSPNIVLATDFVLISWQVLICARGVVGNNYPCWIALWADWASLLGMASMYFMRVWLLYFRHELTYEFLQSSRDTIKQKLSAKPAPAGSEESSAVVESTGWFTKNKHLKTRGFLVPFALIACAIGLLPPIVHTVMNQYSTDTGANFNDSVGWNCNNGTSTILLAAYTIVFAILFSALAYRMRLVVDGFGIKADLRITGVGAGLTAIVWLIFKVLVTRVNQEKFPFSTLVALMFAQTAFFSHTYYPVWRTYYRPPLIEIHNPAGQDLTTLRGILTTPSSFAVFQKFMIQEFCVENLLFWNDVEQFKSPETSLSDEGTVWKLGRDIFAKYIRPGASLEVNIPSELRNDIIDYFNKNGPTGGVAKKQYNGVAGEFVSPSTPPAGNGNGANPLADAISVAPGNGGAFDQKDGAGTAPAADAVAEPPKQMGHEKRRSQLGFDTMHGTDSNSFAATAAAAVLAASPRASSGNISPISASAAAAAADPLGPAQQSGSKVALLGKATTASSDPVIGSIPAGSTPPAFIVNIEPYPCQKVFQIAQDNIFALMESDPYQRFKYSDLYKVMCARYEMESKKHSALQLVKMA